MNGCGTDLLHTLCSRTTLSIRERSCAAGDRGAHAGPIPEECQALGRQAELLAVGEWRRGRQGGIVRPYQHLPAGQFLAQNTHPYTTGKERGKALLERSCERMQG